MKYIHTMQKNISKAKLLEKIAKLTGVENDNQLAAYLSDRYGCQVTRQQLSQFRRSTTNTVTHVLLMEALSHAQQIKT